MAFNWLCPHCAQSVTMTDSDTQSSYKIVEIKTASKKEVVKIEWLAYKCPNPLCFMITLDLIAGFGEWATPRPGGEVRLVADLTEEGTPKRPVGIGRFRFAPRVARPLSKHVSLGIRADYEEACLIKDISPKASATLCRRALQGMIRDFWKVSKGRLAEELTTIKTNCDPELYDAMMSLKAIGNIGAHPERDTNLMIEVDEGEVESLLGLLQILDKEWYVARADRVERLNIVKSIGASKVAEKSMPAPEERGAKPVPKFDIGAVPAVDHSKS
jgi:hypothetical protein